MGKRFKGVVGPGIGRDRKLQEKGGGQAHRGRPTTGWIMEGWLELG